MEIDGMGCLSRISLYALQFFILLAVALGVTRGLQYMAAEEYAPGDTPHAWFRVVMAGPGDANGTGPSYTVQPWEEVAARQNDIQKPGFLLPESAGNLGQDKDGGHVSYRVIAEQDAEQVIEVKRVDSDYETISRYRATKEGITPLYFRRTSTGIAWRGFLVGFLVAGVAGIPLRRILIKPGEKAAPVAKLE
jgi:hypothetical protein